MNYSKMGLMVLIIVCTLAGKAYANDTSWPTIEIDEIETDTKVGSHISFSGEESRKLMQVLPPISSVWGDEVDSHTRSLKIVSPGYMVVIVCSDRADRAGKIPTTPNCQIRFDIKQWEGPFPFEPKLQCSAKD